jgi:hypothetical protein
MIVNNEFDRMKFTDVASIGGPEDNSVNLRIAGLQAEI